MKSLRSFCVLLALVLSLLGFSVTAQAGIMRDDVPDSAYLAYAQDPMFQSAGWIGLMDADGQLTSHWGSAVLIDTHWAVTAAHMFELPYSSLSFGLGPNLFTDPGETRTVTASYVHPNYSGGSSWTTEDIALVYFADPILDVIPARRFYGSDAVGTHVSIIGFGTPATASAGLLPDDGYERGGENIVNRIGWSTFGIGTNYLLADFGPLRSTPSLPLEHGATAGNSGGGLYNDSGELVALSTFGWGELSYTGAIRISLYNDWIDETMGANVPEPPTWAMFASGPPFLWLLLRRRNRRALAG